MRYIGLDVGDKRIGIALSDAEGIIASPLEVYANSGDIKKSVAYIVNIAKQKEASAIVVGLPLMLSGEDSPQTQKVRAFAEELKKSFGPKVILFDERFSTAAVERVLIDADVSRKKRKGKIDAMAAVYILQCFLDSPRLDT